MLLKDAGSEGFSYVNVCVWGRLRQEVAGTAWKMTCVWKLRCRTI